MDIAERKKLLLAEDEILWETCAADFRKGTGNGGQKLNKTSSAVRIFHPETGITVNCLESRSQSVNRHLALKKLRFRIALLKTDEKKVLFSEQYKLKEVK